MSPVFKIILTVVCLCLSFFSLVKFLFTVQQTDHRSEFLTGAHANVYYNSSDLCFKTIINSSHLVLNYTAFDSIVTSSYFSRGLLSKFYTHHFNCDLCGCFLQGYSKNLYFYLTLFFLLICNVLSGVTLFYVLFKLKIFQYPYTYVGDSNEMVYMSTQSAV